MSESHEPIAYAEQVSFLRDSVQALTAEALEVFQEDFAQFFHREARRRFLGSHEFARSMDDAKLKALKAGLDSGGKAATARVIEKLRDMDLWLSGTMVADPAGKSFEDNPRLWEVVSSIGDDVEALLAANGFPKDPDGTYGVRYHEPKRFVSGHYLPSIAEKYWRRIAELREVEEKIAELEDERERAELLSRWNRF